MEHEAFLNRSPIAIGASLVIRGSSLQTSDVLVIEHDASRYGATIKSFGLGRLVIDIEGSRISLRPWHSGDDPTPSVSGPSSVWTVNAIAEAAD